MGSDPIPDRGEDKAAVLRLFAPDFGEAQGLLVKFKLRSRSSTLMLFRGKFKTHGRFPSSTRLWFHFFYGFIMWESR